MKSQLEATQMWFLWRTLQIAMTDKVSNKEDFKEPIHQDIS